jgi:SGNH hydrolase-like domain, acetyltransferase AlgX
MIHNKLKSILLFGFMLILWLPMVQMVTGLPDLPKLDENRKLTPQPTLKSWADINQYTRDSVKWFDDNFGFRDFLIRAKTQVDYSVFNISDKVHIGSDGWLFYRSVIDVGQPQIEVTLRKDMDAIVDGTQQLANKLSARGIKLVIMIAPMKDVFYAEHLPNTAKKLPNPRQVDLLQDRLRAMKDIIFLDSTAILRELALKRNVFHKTDFHWNDPAAFEVTRVLINEIGKLEGKMNPVWTHNLEIEEKPLSGGEASFMPIFFPPTENALFVKPNWVQPPYNYVEHKPPFLWIYEVKEPTGQELPPIAILGDSFFDGMLRSGIWIYFKKVYRANPNDTSFRDVVNNLPEDTKYFFLEFIENDSRGFAGLASERREEQSEK